MSTIVADSLPHSLCGVIASGAGSNAAAWHSWRTKSRGTRGLSGGGGMFSPGHLAAEPGLDDDQLRHECRVPVRRMAVIIGG